MQDKKIILITGATSGMGLATLRKLAEEGHIVYGTARTAQDVPVIKNAGGLPLIADVTDFKTLQKIVDTIIANEKKIDILFNNAGYGLYGSVEEVPLDVARHQFEVNLFGLARLTQLVIPHMRKQKSGRIINMSSMGGKIYTPFGAWYHASKHALEGWSDCLRFELKPFGIDVIIIEPGTIDTPWNNVMIGNLIKYSGEGPYKPLVNRYLNKARSNKGSPSSLIANLVNIAVTSKRPKTRYSGGKFAKPFIFIRTIFGDRAFDWVINRMI